MPVIRLEGVTKRYENKALGAEAVTLRIEEGDFLFVIGRTGAGKTTLLRLITRDFDPTEGNVYIDDENMRNIPNRKMPYFRRRYGVVWRDPYLIPNKTVYENVALAMFAIRQPKAVIEQSVPMALGIVGMRKKADFYPRDLSGGERFKVALARAIINQPEILVADEPTANLDRDSAWDIMCLLEEINRRGTTVIVATHAHELVKIMGKRVATMIRGRLFVDVSKRLYGKMT